jgi:hypothetical protein
VEIFCSYSHTLEDDDLRARFEKSLSGLIRKKVVQMWHDRRIFPGTHWAPDIDEHLNSADIIAFLVSPDSIASDYCCVKELGRALEREKRKEALVVPIIVRACDWSDTPLADLQAVPDDGRPVTSWPNQDEAWANVATSLKKTVHKVLSAKLEVLASLEAKSKSAPATTPVSLPQQSFMKKQIEQFEEEQKQASAIYAQIARDAAAQSEERKRIAADLQAKIFALTEESRSDSSPDTKKTAPKKGFNDMDKYIRG